MLVIYVCRAEEVVRVTDSLAGGGLLIRGRDSTAGTGIVVSMIVDSSLVGDLLEEDRWVDVVVGIMLFRTGVEFEGGGDCSGGDCILR